MDSWLESLVPWGTEVIVYAQALSNEWLTPGDYLDAVRECFGGPIPLDPASRPTCPGRVPKLAADPTCFDLGPGST